MDNEFLHGLAAEPTDFLVGFTLEPDYEGPCSLAPPPFPTVTTVMHDGIDNYQTLANGANAATYGVTGLMTVVQWSNAHYDVVAPGTIFLFPGTYDSNPPPYVGEARLNGAAHPPLLPGKGTLHGKMCDLLNQPRENFIGFSAKYPVRTAGNIGYRSGSCNPFWFGSNELPQQWKTLVRDTLLLHLPLPVPVPVPVGAGHPSDGCGHRRPCRICDGDNGDGRPATWYRAHDGATVSMANS